MAIHAWLALTRHDVMAIDACVTHACRYVMAALYLHMDKSSMSTNTFFYFSR